MAEPLRTVRDLAKQLGISTASVYRFRSEGKDHLLPPCIMVGVQPRWRQETIDKWLARQEEEGHAA